MTKRKLIDIFKNKIFPKQAEDLLKMNYEGLGELDKKEYLRDTSTLIKLAEKGLKSEQEVIKPYIEKLKAEVESLERFEIRGEVTPLVNVDRVLEIINKTESEEE